MDHITKIMESYNEMHRKKCQNFINEKVPKFEHRTSIPKLLDVNKTLKKTQIECIESMGFGSFARLQLDHLDKGILRWIVERYDPYNNCLNIRHHCYSLDDKDIENAFGVPATGQTILLDNLCSDGLQKYGNLFTLIDGRVDMKSLVESLKACDNTGDEFKVMYMALLFGTVLFPSCRQNLPIHYLNPLVAINNIKELNWASLILEVLSDGIRQWTKKEQTYICGSLLFLQVFFFATIRPKISQCTINLTSERPFLEFVTRQRVSSLMSDISKSGGYWSENACTFVFKESPTRSQRNTLFNDVQHTGKTKVETNVKTEVKTKVKTEVGVVEVASEHRDRDFPSDLQKFMSKQNEDRSTEGFKEDVINHSHETRQKEKVHDNFHTGTKLSLLSAQVTGHDKRITGSENQIAQLISIMDNFSNRLASVDQGGYQTVNQELGNKIVAMLQNLEATLPQLIRDALDEVMFKTNKQQKSLNVNIESPNMVESVFEMTKNNTIDLTSYDAEQPVAAKQEEAPISPEEHEDVIIDYLFNPNLDQRMSVIKFEAIGCNRNDLLCLKPETFLNGTVIDCVAHMLTQKAKENFAENKLFLPAQFAQLCLAGKTIINDDKIIPFLRYLTNEVEDDCQIYLPINDHKGHWFLGIVDLEMKHVLICDTLLSDATKDYRRNLLYEVITRMECLFEKLMPCKYRIKSIQDKFECDYPTWVPKQPNFYDCGVYVCMMMMFDRGIQQLSESQSVVVRERIAVAMYKWKNNKFAWPR